MRQQLTYLARGQTIEVLLTSENEEKVLGYIIHLKKPKSHFAFGGYKHALPGWVLQEIADKVNRMDELYGLPQNIHVD